MNSLEIVLPAFDPVTRDGEIAHLRARLAEAEEALAALRTGAADALLGETGVLYLSGADETYVTFFGAMNEGGVTLDGAGTILHCNKRFAEMMGRSVRGLRGKPVLSCIGTRNRVEATRLLAHSTAGACEVDLRTFNGDARPVRLSLTRKDAGERHFGCLVITDLTERMLVERDLEQLIAERTGELRLAASVFENTLEGVMVTDADGFILSVNPAFTGITGYSSGEVIGRTPAVLRSQRHESAFYSELWETLRVDGLWRGEIWNRRKSGEAYLQRTTINLVPARYNQPASYVAVFSDITEFWRNDERIAHLAYHDPLTDLPNRALLQDRLSHALKVAIRQREPLGVLFIDLDGFKAVNDQLGHHVGDELLQEVAIRLRAVVRNSDTVARYGGDEFVVLMENLENTDECATLAAKLNMSLTWEGRAGELPVRIGASVGIAVYPQDGADAATLLKHADAALYVAKAAGKSTFRYFDAQSDPVSDCHKGATLCPPPSVTPT